MATNETTALTSAPKNAVAKAEPDLKEVLFSEDTLTQIRRALPKHMTPERMARLALTEFRMNESLANCTPQSVVAAVIQCSQLGLDIGGVLGHAYLVPYKREAKLMVGYKGYIELAVRSGQVTNITASTVYEKDEFDYELGLNPDIKHKPTKENDRGEVVAAYAIAWLKSGGRQFVVLNRADIEKARSCSKMPNSEPWTKFYAEMAKKTAIRALSKQLTLSPELRLAVETDERNETAIDVEFETLIDNEGRVLNAATGEVISEPPSAQSGGSAIDVPATPVPEAPGQTSLPLGGDDDKY
jgi:recombination protein RecT